MTSLYSLVCWNFHNHIIKNCKNSGVQLVPLMLKFLGMYLRDPCGARYPQPTFQFSRPLVLLNSDSKGDRKGPWEVNQTAFNDVTLVSFLMNHNQK